MIVTFYSYKGGTGRTMALANIAVLLARAGNKVLAIDFDLEAPGLWRFFEDFDPGLSRRRGLLDMLMAQTRNTSGQSVDWRDYIVPVNVEGGSFSLMTSGRFDIGYAARVLGFNWQKFFRFNDGGSFIEQLRSEWAKEYDFTLIDSRTGITDTGGVCTIALPDLIVPVFVANNQNIEGVLEVLRRAQVGRQSLAYDRSPALILPVLSRFDTRTEYESADEWLNLLAEKLGEFYKDWLPVSIPVRRVLERTKLPYVAYFSFGEKLAVMRQGISDPESLGYALNSITRLIDSHLTAAAAVTDGATPTTPARPVPQIIGGVPPQNPNFVGRQEILQEIRRSLHKRDSVAVLHTLQGISGVGKSQLVAEYARRFQADYDLIWWIPSYNDPALRRSLVALARRLGLPESADMTNTVETVVEALRVGQPTPNWLLIYDGAAEPGELRAYLPDGPGHVLITSRSQSWVAESAAIQVGVFSPAESVTFLRRRWAGITKEDAQAIADELGHLPLALEQAVAVHMETGMPQAEYLRLLRENPGQILAEGETSTSSVARTWQLAFEQLRSHSPNAVLLLELCSFLGSDLIAVPMLARGRGAPVPSQLADTLRDDIKMRQAIRDLGRYGLAQIDVSNDSIRIHRLVRALVRERLAGDRHAEAVRNAHELLALANPGAPDNDLTWSQHAQITPHVIPSGVILSDDPHVRRIVLDQIRYLFVVGDYAQSELLAARAVTTWVDSLEPDDEMTLVACFHLGNALRALGEDERARDINRETFRRMQLVLGPDHEYTLRMANSLGADLRLVGDFRQALEIDEQNLGRYRGALGDDDPAVLRSANNLAVDYRLLGDYEKAQAIDEDTLRRREVILGDYNPEVLSSVSSISRDFYGLGEYEIALKIVKDGLLKYESLMPSHTFVAIAKQNVAILMRKTGRYSEALELAEENLEFSRSRLGPRHVICLSAMMTLGNTLRAYGDVARARTTAEEALDLYRAQFSGEHPFTLACANNLAIVYRVLGRMSDARALDTTTLDTLVRTLGEDHRYTVCSFANMVNNLALAGEYAEARDMSTEALERSRRVRSADHPDTLACAANLALDLDATGAEAASAELRENTLEQLRRRLGAEHPVTVSVERGRRMEFDIEPPPT